jgi:hypothetical protein
VHSGRSGVGVFPAHPHCLAIASKSSRSSLTYSYDFKTAPVRRGGDIPQPPSGSGGLITSSLLPHSTPSFSLQKPCTHSLPFTIVRERIPRHCLRSLTNVQHSGVMRLFRCLVSLVASACIFSTAVYGKSRKTRNEADGAKYRQQIHNRATPLSTSRS